MDSEHVDVRLEQAAIGNGARYRREFESLGNEIELEEMILAGGAEKRPPDHVEAGARPLAGEVGQGSERVRQFRKRKVDGRLQRRLRPENEGRLKIHIGSFPL